MDEQVTQMWWLMRNDRRNRATFTVWPHELKETYEDFTYVKVSVHVNITQNMVYSIILR